MIANGSCINLQDLDRVEAVILTSCAEICFKFIIFTSCRAFLKPACQKDGNKGLRLKIVQDGKEARALDTSAEGCDFERMMKLVIQFLNDQHLNLRFMPSPCLSFG